MYTIRSQSTIDLIQKALDLPSFCIPITPFLCFQIMLTIWVYTYVTRLVSKHPVYLVYREPFLGHLSLCLLSFNASVL